ncbi:MAG: hypothetical protein FH749_02450 [Firmicutes bacterium]|nr:hypothetical protein [Bacillota bacterium]
MKKLFTLLLVLMMATALVACGDGDSSAPDNNDSGQSDQDNGNGADLGEVTVDEQVLVDQDGVIIKAVALDDSWLGPELKVYIENNSDESITVQARNTSVNGFMVDPTFSPEVMPDKKANDAITFSDSEFERYGIETITDIELNFLVFNSDTWDEIFFSDLVTVETSAAGSYTQEYDTSGDVVYDDQGMTIIYKGMTDDSIFGPGIRFYLENNSDEPLTVQVRNVSVNGFMIEPTFSPEIMPGKKALADATFFDSDFEDNGIETVTEIELNFYIFHTDTWDSVAETPSITITP